VIAAAVAGTTRPFGTSDFISYAAYGRELVTGHNPYLVAPRTLARLGDPVARAVQDWSGTPSVYGALAAGVFGVASLVGGTSARLTVFVLDVVNALAFAGTGVLLDRLAQGPAARLRAAVLWTCNPLLLQILVAGSHVDGLAAAFSIGGIAVLAPVIPNGRFLDSSRAAPLLVASRPSRGALRGVLAGILLGLGFAVKPTILLVGAGLAITVAAAASELTSAPQTAVKSLAWPPLRVLCGMAAGFAAVAGADFALIGRAGIEQTLRASGMVSVGSPWRVARTLLGQVMAEPTADDMVRWCAVALALFLAARLLPLRVPWLGAQGADHAIDHTLMRPNAQSAYSPWTGAAAGRAGSTVGWAAFALVLAWLMAWPYVLPWYDSLAWALLPLLPASGFDWLLLARTATLSFGYLPARSAGITIPGGLRWMEPVLRSAVVPAVLAVLLVILVRWTARSPRRADFADARGGGGSGPPARPADADNS
jgi:hypothetical protein